MTESVGTEFAELTDPYRRELLAYCYRMLGSVHDAEDQVQETLLRAWRAYGGYDPQRASLRTWLYRIATNACLTAIEQRGRRAMPSGLGAPSTDPTAPLRPPTHEVAWLEPVPDALLAPQPGDPATIVDTRAGIRLAFVAAMQHLPARQRAVLILREVLSWPAAEVAEALGMTTAAVNSALQRARAQLAQVAPVEAEMTEPDDEEQREVLERYVAAFLEADLAALVRLLRKDVELEMPPMLNWFVGAEAVERFFASRMLPDRWRMTVTRANGQPAVAMYVRDEDGVYRAHNIGLLTVDEGRISRIVAFADPRLHELFGLPMVAG